MGDPACLHPHQHEPTHLRDAALRPEAITIVASWLARDAVFVLEAGEQCWEILKSLLVDAQVKGPLVMDAFLAALALENGATLASTDRDFSRFPKLRVNDPSARSKG